MKTRKGVVVELQNPLAKSFGYIRRKYSEYPIFDSDAVQKSSELLGVCEQEFYWELNEMFRSNDEHTVRLIKQFFLKGLIPDEMLSRCERYLKKNHQHAFLEAASFQIYGQ